MGAWGPNYFPFLNHCAVGKHMLNAIVNMVKCRNFESLKGQKPKMSHIACKNYYLSIALFVFFLII